MENGCREVVDVSSEHLERCRIHPTTEAQREAVKTRMVRTTTSVTFDEKLGKAVVASLGSGNPTLKAYAEELFLLHVSKQPKIERIKELENLIMQATEEK